jgi:hypothetical protein
MDLYLLERSYHPTPAQFLQSEFQLREAERASPPPEQVDVEPDAPEKTHFAMRLTVFGLFERRMSLFKVIKRRISTHQLG